MDNITVVDLVADLREDARRRHQTVTPLSHRMRCIWIEFSCGGQRRRSNDCAGQWLVV